jgi:hypothetical protein
MILEQGFGCIHGDDESSLWMMSSLYQDLDRIRRRDIKISKQGVGGPRGARKSSPFVISSPYQDLINLDG